MTMTDMAATTINTKIIMMTNDCATVSFTDDDDDDDDDDGDHMGQSQ
jgi:hypothetical protein